MNKQELIEHYEKILDYGFLSVAEEKIYTGFVEKLKQLDKPQPIKLKDVIARIGEFNLATKAVWINEILNKLGSDYGAFKYKDGYEQGKLEATLEREKVTVPQYVADWYEKHKSNLEYELWNYIRDWEDQKPSEFKRWFDKSNNAFRTLVNMHQFGYEIEKEKRYLVKMKGVSSNICYLNRVGNKWIIAGINEHTGMNIYTKHTKKELEEAGFGWVFDCSGIEIEEVEE